jgi:glycosyltransferase involved in cell wall biosynthesis
MSKTFKRKKILICTWTYPPEQNGVAHVAWNHAEGLAKTGHEVTVATTYKVNRKEGSGNIKVIQFDIQGRWTPKTILKPFRGDVKGFRSFVENYQGDIIMFHSTTVWSTDTVLDILNLTKTKNILVSHGVSFNSGSILARLGWQVYVNRLSNIYSSFNHIVFLSEKSDKDRFLDKYIIEKKKSVHWSVIPNGASNDFLHDELPDFRKSFHIKKNTKMILCVAAYSPMKNQELALNAFINSAQDNAVIVFIGSEFNEYTKHLKNKVKSFNADERVLFMERVDREMIYAAYKTANLFLHPSRTEVQPLVILDAIASGTPFISTNVGCVSDINGGVVINSEKEMSNEINKILSNTNIYKKLVIEGKRDAKQIYSWKKILYNYNSLFESLSYY